MLNRQFWLASLAYIVVATAVACGVDAASSGARPLDQTPVDPAPPEYIIFEDMRYRLVSSVAAPRDDMDEAGSVILQGGSQLDVFRMSHDERALYTPRSPASPEILAGVWYRWLPSPETPVPHDLRNRT